jgi:hypothetical protein
MKLYPRLGNQAATSLYRELDELTAEERAERISIDHPAVTWSATGAERIHQDELRAVRATLVAVAEGHGFPDTVLRRADLAPFDRELARSLFENTHLPLAEAAFPGVWSFLALVLLPDLTWWRAQGSTNIERYVCSDQTRHTLARLWQRAHLLTFGAEDEEGAWDLLESSDIGEAQLDQIQTRRGAYGQTPSAFRAILRLYARVGDSTRFARGADGFYARLMRMGAFIDFRTLSDEELDDHFAATFEALGPASDEPSALDDTEAREEPLTFDELPLDEVMLRLVEGVRAAGPSTDAQLVGVFESVTGIEVPAGRRELVRGVAWQASSRNYLELDEPTQRWRPGSVLPAPDSRWGGRTVDSIKDVIRTSNGTFDADQVAGEVFAGRVGRTIRRFIRALAEEVEGERSGRS